ncbi:MAG: pyruvate kinase [Bifidobacteriaceae bacterium]|jgi:pyruvate kinase|nr:pyruvate kinase [Bifidobacteriaceae bacterium]
MRRAKIVSTIGPVTEGYEQIKKLIIAGMDVARLNRSHGDPETHLKVYNNIRKASAELGRNTAVLVDLQGPKIRLGVFADGKKPVLVKGDTFIITTDDILGDEKKVSTTFKGLPADCKPGELLLVDDGKVRLEVVEVKENEVVTKVKVGGPVSDHKGLNLPGVAVSIPALTQKDEEDLRWGIKTGADLIAMSFVRSPDDIIRTHQIMEEEGRKMPIIAKIEKPQAVENLEAIIKTFDGIMVARGDLAVECPLERVPIIQRKCINLARQYAKPVIIATQMLESMTDNPTPTRAEINDCAIAVIEGADATMTSGETSVGKYPIETIEVMSKISEYQTDNGLDLVPTISNYDWSGGGAIAFSAVKIAETINAKCIAVFTTSGSTVNRIARMRTRIPIYALSSEEHSHRALSLTWGSWSYLSGEPENMKDALAKADLTLKGAGLVENGDKVVIVFGSIFGQVGSTNSITVHDVGHSL